MISDSGDALLCDFGLSILVESSFNVSAFRDQDLVRWMAPEALREEGPSTKCDVYAFGMTALVNVSSVNNAQCRTLTDDMIQELFSREQPYSNVLDPSDVCTAVMKGVIPARPNDDATLERLNDAWWSLCCACWESDPDSRPAAQHVVDSLKTIDRNVTRLKVNATRHLCPYTQRLTCYLRETKMSSLRLIHRWPHPTKNTTKNTSLCFNAWRFVRLKQRQPLWILGIDCDTLLDFDNAFN